MDSSECLQCMASTLFNLSIIDKSSRRDWYKFSLALDDRVLRMIMHNTDRYWFDK